MTDRELDRMMQHVLLDAIKRDCEKETDDVPAFKPTRHYQRQIAAMLKDPLKWERRRARPLWKNVAQKAAVILLVFSLSLGSLMAVSPTVRAAVVRWVTEWYETHIVYRYSGEQIIGEMPQYEITDLPEGYIEDERVNWPSYVSVVYQNKDRMNREFLHKITLLGCLFLLITSSSGTDNGFQTPEQYAQIVQEHFANEEWEAGKELLEEGLQKYPNVSFLFKS